MIGLQCVDPAGTPLGTVVAVEDFGAGELLEVEQAGAKRALVPFRPGIADLADGRVTINPDYLA